ncbi:hypothetical protein EDD15DRAFT_2519049 [Pisolithus albus]|nr:hypothetical protein EDD15DRAFT_2519049 [Pisolithus albus]
MPMTISVMTALSAHVHPGKRSGTTYSIVKPSKGAPMSLVGPLPDKASGMTVSIAATLRMRNLPLQQCHKHRVLRLAHTLRPSGYGGQQHMSRGRGLSLILSGPMISQTALYSDCSGTSNNNVLVPQSSPPSHRNPTRVFVAIHGPSFLLPIGHAVAARVHLVYTSESYVKVNIQRQPTPVPGVCSRHHACTAYDNDSVSP